MAKKATYDNESISSLKGADRVRKRPGVIFGSDGLEGCEHAVFEILSNAIDEAREGHGRLITVTRFSDLSIQVEDMGRGCPVDWNEKEGRYNWELVFCELYAGGKYDNENSENYEFSLGLNGLGSCATQYASRYMDVTVWREGKEYSLHFERGEIVGQLQTRPLPDSQKRKTGTRIHWLPDLDVFTDIQIPPDYYRDVMKRQAVVNAGVTFRLRNQNGAAFDTEDFLYENGIANGVPGIRLLTAEETLAMEPQLAPTVAGALFAPSAAIVSPWEFALAMAEVAVRNGVELYRSTPVTNIEKIDGGWQLTTPNGPLCGQCGGTERPGHP